MQWCCRHLVVVELCKVVDDDGDGQCHHQDAADRTTCSDQLAKTWSMWSRLKFEANFFSTFWSFVWNYRWSGTCRRSQRWSSWWSPTWWRKNNIWVFSRHLSLALNNSDLEPKRSQFIIFASRYLPKWSRNWCEARLLFILSSGCVKF